MEQNNKKGWLYLLPAVLFLLGGILLGIRVFLAFEQFAVLYGYHGALLDTFREIAIFAGASGGLVVLGVLILLILVLHMMRRSTRIQREAEVLRRKNKAVE